MGGGNAQKTANSRAKHLEKEKGASAGKIHVLSCSIPVLIA
jgi:hypothetical protein